MIFNVEALFNYILSIIPLPAAMISGYPTALGKPNNLIYDLGGTKDKTLFVIHEVEFIWSRYIIIFSSIEGLSMYEK